MLVQQDLSKYNINSLKRCYGTGEPLNPEIISAWQAYSGLAIAESYGQMETCILCASWEEIEMRPGSMGKAAPGYDLQVVSSDGEIVEAGEEGDIAVRVSRESSLGGVTGERMGLIASGTLLQPPFA